MSVQEDYKLVMNPLGFIAKKEVTNTDPAYLVAPSQNVLINDADKVVGRGGMTLFGDAYTVNKGVKSSFEWDTSSARQRALRVYDDELEVYVYDEWRRIKNNWTSTKFVFTTWWDSTESIDLLLFVIGDANIYDWSGAVTKIASVGANTLTKMWYLSGTTFAFNPAVGATPAYITDSGNGFVIAGYEVGDVIIVSGSASNNKSFTIAGVSAGTLVLIAADSLVSEAAGASVTIRKENCGSWAEERFLTTGTRKVMINDVEYTYTGGENTGTLTGVTPDPAVAAPAIANGDVVIQSVRTNTDKPISGNINDSISVLNNQVYILSTHSREVYVSKTSDFKDFAFSTPVRVPGEGALLTLDSYGVGFIPQEEDMYIFAGTDDAYKTNFQLADDGQHETLTIKKLKTAPRSSAISQDAISHIKNNVVFISNEPTLDTLGRIEQINTPQAVPISDPIKDNFSFYDFTGAHTKYHRNIIYIALPSEGIFLMYDLQNQRWQPPQVGAISRFAVIDGELYAHSSGRNETYKMFDGTNDNGVAINFIVAFAYNNYGYRSKTKIFDEYFSELYISRGAQMTMTILFDYRGATEIKEFTIDGSDEDILFTPNVSVGAFGELPFGEGGFGSSTEEEAVLSKCRVIHTLKGVDFFEEQTVYSCNTLDAQFEMIAHGSNASISTNTLRSIKK